MNLNISNQDLTESESIEIKRLLKRENKPLSNDLEQMCYLLDLVWDD